MITRKRPLSHLSQRVIQTHALFDNYPKVFYDLARSLTPWPNQEMTFRLRNGCVVVSPNADGARFPIYEIFADDAYRLEWMCADLPKDLRVLDIGGQIGCFSLAVARRGKDVRVHTYEASPVSASYVQRNVSGNGLDDQVTVYAEALSGHAGTFTFVDSGTASGHNGLTAPEGLGTEVTVECNTFDEAVRRLDGRVDLVKIDVEGAEYDILLKSDPASWATVQRMVMEYHPLEGHHLDELTDFLARVGLHEAEHIRGTRAGLGVMWLSR